MMLPAAAKQTPETKSAPGRILLLALGHDFLGDEDVGLIAAGLLKGEFRNRVDIIVGPGALALLGLLECYDRVLLLDAVFTREVPPGTVREFCPADFHREAAPSGHSFVLPEVLRLAERMGLNFPGSCASWPWKWKTPGRLARAWVRLPSRPCRAMWTGRARC
ncbi:MAG: hypothetical protein M0P73_06180 [Syntrophobacterales bacterium]|jgi:hydrogenase maturation protease|nr:hypothetical protein [Syntrophobacterales bacterium]